MFVIAITGGIGSGKTTATRYFRDKGAVVIDLDEIAHDLLEPGGEPYSAIVDEFGAGVLDASGRVDRPALAGIAFASEETCRRLNAITHPAVMREVLPNLTNLRLLPEPPRVVILEVPLLVEAPAFGEAADAVLAISADEELRLARCVRHGRSEADARARMACQATDAEREAIADWTIVNEGSLDELTSALDRFWDEVVRHGAA
jgi:dephospho-CoA kinase